MSSRRATVAIAAAVVVAVAMRAGFLHWSPLPATLDGFGYAGKAAQIVSTGQFQPALLSSDDVITAVFLGAASELTGVRPLYLAQPLVAIAGGGAALSGYVVVRAVGRSHGWSSSRIRQAGAVVVFALAVEGMFLRRTGVPDEEAYGLLLLPLFALAAHRLLIDRQPRWLGVLLPVALVYPPLHNFSAIAAAFVLTALVSAHVACRSDTRTVILGTATLCGYWGYYFGYYVLADELGLKITYSELVSQHPGSLLAWVVAVLVGAAWFPVASARARRAMFGLPLVGFFTVAAANALRPVFPGTVETPPLVLALVAVYIVPVALFVWGVPRVDRGESLLAVALLVGPAGLILFSITTSLSPAFLGAAMRSQTFGHVGAFGVAAIAVVAIAVERPYLSRVLVAGLLVASLVTAPFAFIHLDTATVPRTIHESEFGAASFAALHTPGPYTSDDRLTRIASVYYGTGATENPTRTWLYGGPPPDCATLAQRAWTTDGAHFYPAPPATLSAGEYREWKRSVDIVYSTNGWTETVLGTPGGC